MKNGWHTKRLGDFAVAVSTGPFGSVLHKSDYVDDGIPLINPINMVNGSIIPDPSKLISALTKQRLSSYVLQEGDVVVARRGEIGRCAVVGRNEAGWVCGTGSFYIRPFPTLDSHFLAHLIRSNGYRDKLEQISTGTTMRNLSNTALRDLSISVPPLIEQKRLVGILDDAFADIATAKANAEKNLQNARRLFESRQHELLAKDLKACAQRPLGTLVSFRNGINYTKTSKGESVQVVGVRAFLNRFSVPPNDLDEVIIDGALDEADLLRKGDLVTVRSNGNPELIGRCMLTDELVGRVTHSGFTIRLRPITEDVLPSFLCYFMRSGETRAKLTQGGTGTNIKSLNQAMLSGLIVPVPSLAEQRRLVAHLMSAASASESLAALYKRKIGALEKLKTALLQQAFSGNL